MFKHLRGAFFFLELKIIKFFHEMNVLNHKKKYYLFHNPKVFNHIVKKFPVASKTFYLTKSELQLVKLFMISGNKIRCSAYFMYAPDMEDLCSVCT